MTGVNSISSARDFPDPTKLVEQIEPDRHIAALNRRHRILVLTALPENFRNLRRKDSGLGFEQPHGVPA